MPACRRFVDEADAHSDTPRATVSRTLYAIALTEAATAGYVRGPAGRDPATGKGGMLTGTFLSASTSQNLSRGVRRSGGGDFEGPGLHAAGPFAFQGTDDSDDIDRARPNDHTVHGAAA